MKQSLRDYISKYSTILKRSLAAIALFWMFIAIQTYNNYLTIIESTTITLKQAQKVLDEISYFNHFQLKYLNSDHAQRFTAHENNILTQGEAIISFQEKQAPLELSGNIKETIQQSSPREERKKFFAKKFD